MGMILSELEKFSRAQSLNFRYLIAAIIAANCAQQIGTISKGSIIILCSITIEIGELPKYPKINSTSGRLTDQIKLNDIEEFEYRVVRINNVLYNSKIASNYSRIDGKVSQNQLVLPIKSKG